MKPADEIKRLIHESEMTSGPGADDRILGDALDLLDKRRAGRTKHSSPALWRTIMSNRATKIAATVTILAGLLVAIYLLGNPLGSTITFASVIEPILNANTAVLDIIVGEDAEGVPVIHDMVMGSRIRRTVSNVGEIVSILDLKDSRILVLSEKDKTAQYVKMEGLPSIPNYLEHLKNVLVMLQEQPDFELKNLGEQEIDGRVLVGFKAEHPKIDITLWADPETGLPVRIEQNDGQMHVICKNLRFDVPMEESLFSMDVPEGYTSQGETAMDLMGATEEDFIEGLRIRAQVFGDGYFPDGVGIDDFMRSIEAMQGKGEELGLSKDQEAELGVKMNKHLLFIRFFQGQGKWYYRGQGVTLGEADKAIFWYRLKGSATYRVIYGDLHVEDVAPEDLPEPLDADDTAGLSAGYEQGAGASFVGTQADTWTVDATGRITVESEIILSKGPEGAGTMPVTLPYETGVLNSVTLGDAAIPFTQAGSSKYELQLPLERLVAGDRKITCRWQLSLGELPEKQHNDLSYYEVKLETLIPVTAYSLKANLALDSGFEFSTDPSKTSLTLFSIGRADGKTHFGTCGLPIQERD